MNKTNNNLINYALGILGFSILSVMFVVPMQANAGFYSAGSGISMSTQTTPTTTTTTTTVTPPVTTTVVTPPVDPQPTINPVPVIYSISPDSVKTKSGAVLVTITGANFVSGSVARWNSEERATTFVSSTKLTMLISTVDTTGVGDYAVTVFSPTPGGGMSNAAIFHLKKTATVNTAPSTTTPKKTTGASKGTTGSKDSLLAAGALFGMDGLMPTTLTQWLLLLALILLIVILARKAFFQEKPKEVPPLKHA